MKIIEKHKQNCFCWIKTDTNEKVISSVFILFSFFVEEDSRRVCQEMFLWSLKSFHLISEFKSKGLLIIIYVS